MPIGTSTLTPLDEPTRSRLRSTQILVSLPQIAAELIQNVLDAGATNVDVGVHAGEWAFWVCDDGCGFTKDGLERIAQGGEEG